MKTDNDLPAKTISDSPAASAAAALPQSVSVRVGDSCLTRDLVWCECGRGLSRNGKWLFCPRCGHPIDQKSYAAACMTALANGADHFTYQDADLVNEMTALRSAAVALVTAMETCHQCGTTLLVDEPISHCEDGCSSDCDDHDEPNCPSIYDLHLALKRLAQGSRLRTAAGKS